MFAAIKIQKFNFVVWPALKCYGFNQVCNSAELVL